MSDNKPEVRDDYPCIVISNSHSKILEQRIIVIPDADFLQLVHGLHPLYAKGIHDLFLFGIPNIVMRSSAVQGIIERMHTPSILTPRKPQ